MEFINGFDRIRDKDWAACRFLDLGSSEGSTTLRLGETGAAVHGVEGRADAVHRANAIRDVVGFGNVTFSVGNVDHPGSFREVDGIFNAGILYHLEDPVTFLERCAAHARIFMYVDTGHAPRSDDELKNSKFSQAFGDRLTLDYRGLKLDAINFAEPRDTAEKQDGMRRKPRAGIGNTNSVWISHASLVDLMGELGFPHHEVVSDRPIIPRLRTCFWRQTPRPPSKIAALPQPLPPARPQREAVIATRARDIAHLQRSGEAVTLFGREPLLSKVRRDLEDNGVVVREMVEVPGAFEEPIGLGMARKLLEGRSGLLVTAVADTHQAVFRLMLLDRFGYVFTSFGLYHIV
jgi:hypothetical protein